MKIKFFLLNPLRYQRRNISYITKDRCEKFWYFYNESFLMIDQYYSVQFDIYSSKVWNLLSHGGAG